MGFGEKLARAYKKIKTSVAFCVAGRIKAN